MDSWDNILPQINYNRLQVLPGEERLCLLQRWLTWRSDTVAIVAGIATIAVVDWVAAKIPFKNSTRIMLQVHRRGDAIGASAK